MSFIEIPERTDEWHNHRMKYIGGSEVAALFGEEDRQEGNDDGEAEDVVAGYSDSLFSLHYIKSGIVPPRPIDSEVVDAGVFMEPSIAQLAAARRGWVLRKGRYAIDDTTPGMGASLDYETIDAGPDADGVFLGGRVMHAFNGPLVGPGVFQIKNVSERQYYRKWINGEPPLYVILQVQHELACSGYRWGVVGAWIGGNTLRLYFYEAHPGIIAMIRERVTEFWQRVQEKRPPNPDGSDATSYALRQLFPVLLNTKEAPIDLTGSNEIPNIIEEFEYHRTQRLIHTEEENLRRNRLRLIMGTATHAKCGDMRINVSVVPPNEGRPAKPGEVIGKKSEVRTLRVSKYIPKSEKKAKNK